MLNDGPARNLRIGIVGYTLGRIRYGPALAHASNLSVAGLVDADTRSLRAWSRDLSNKPAVHPSLASLLASDSDIDVVLVATPIGERSSLIREALQAHKAVLCDVPFTEGVAELEALLAFADECDVPLIPLLPRRFDPWFEEVARLAADGRLGAIHHVRCEWSFPLTLGFALENGVALEPDGWHDLLRAIAWQTIDMSRAWLGDAETISADIDLPEAQASAALALRTSPCPVANLIVGHKGGQSTHLLSRSRSGHSGERYVITAANGHAELTISAGEGGSVAAAPSMIVYQPGRRPEEIIPAARSDGRALSPNHERVRRLLENLAAMLGSPSVQHSCRVDVEAVMDIVHGAYVSAQDDAKVHLPLRN